MSASPSRGGVWKWAAAIALLVAIGVGWYFLPIKQWSEAFQSWIEGLGAWGYVIFAAAYIVGTVLLVPVSAFTIIAGLAFGLGIGFPLVIVSATIGATLAFLVSRYLLSKKVSSFVAKRPKFKAVSAAVSEGGWKVVALLRLSPVLPFNLQNYFYGITELKFWHYVPATFFGIMPGSLLYVYLGSAGKAASGEGGGPLQWTFFGVGLIATLVVVVVVTRQAKKKLKQHGVNDAGAKKTDGGAAGKKTSPTKPKAARGRATGKKR